jgi:hypothetical protein
MWFPFGADGTIGRRNSSRDREPDLVNASFLLFEEKQSYEVPGFLVDVSSPSERTEPPGREILLVKEKQTLGIRGSSLRREAEL